MTDNQLNPPRFAQALLQVLVRAADTESIPGDLLEEYREVRRPSLGGIRADVWYIKHVVSVLWRVIWPCVVAIIALRVFSFPLPGGWNASLVPAPGVSLLDAVILFWAGYLGARRTGRLSTGLVSAGATSLCGFMILPIYVAMTTPSLMLAPFEKPFIFVIISLLLAIALGFGITVGTLGAMVGRRLSSAKPKARLT